MLPVSCAGTSGEIWHDFHKPITKLSLRKYFVILINTELQVLSRISATSYETGGRTRTLISIHNNSLYVFAEARKSLLKNKHRLCVKNCKHLGWEAGRLWKAWSRQRRVSEFDYCNQFQVDSSDKVSFSFFQLENLKRYPFVAFPRTLKFACEMNVSLDPNNVILMIIKGILTCPTQRILIAKGKTAVSISENK